MQITACNSFRGSGNQAALPMGNKKKSLQLEYQMKNVPDIVVISFIGSLLSVGANWGKLANSTLQYKVKYGAAAAAISTLAATGLMTICKAGKKLMFKPENKE